MNNIVKFLTQINYQDEFDLDEIQKEHRLTTHVFNLIEEIKRMHRLIVRCVDSSKGELNLTKGRIYVNHNPDLLTHNIVLIINDKGVRQTYDIRHFKRV